MTPVAHGAETRVRTPFTGFGSAQDGKRRGVARLSPPRSWSSPKARSKQVLSPSLPAGMPRSSLYVILPGPRTRKEALNESGALLTRTSCLSPRGSARCSCIMVLLTRNSRSTLMALPATLRFPPIVGWAGAWLPRPVKVGGGVVRGRAQTINRAELLAVLLACVLFPKARVVTDSKYVCGIARLMSTATWDAWCGRDNHHLLRIAAVLKGLGLFPPPLLVKIPSQTPASRCPRVLRSGLARQSAGGRACG